jgi:hypothetical protein
VAGWLTLRIQLRALRATYGGGLRASLRFGCGLGL